MSAEQTSAMSGLIATQPPDPPKDGERPAKKRRSKKKELLRRQGVLLSTLRGKEKEAAEEVVEALTPIVRRLYPGLLENYADRAASLASEDEDDEFDDALAKALENVEKKKRMPPPPLGIHTVELAHSSYVPIDAFIDPVKVVHAFLQEQQQQATSPLKYTLRMTPCKIVCAANLETVRNTIRAAAIPFFAGLEAKWKKSPTWKLVFQAKSNTELKKNELLANASELITGRKIILDEADVVVSVVAVKNYAGIAFLLDYDKLNRYNTAAPQATPRKEQQETKPSIEDHPGDRATTGTEEFEEVAIPPVAATVTRAVTPPEAISPHQAGRGRSPLNGLNTRRSPGLPPRPPNVIPREPPTHLRPTGLSLPRAPAPHVPSNGPSTDLPPWKLSLPVRRDADDRCWHCGAKEEHFGRPQLEIAEEWARLERERERLEALRQQIEAQQGPSGVGAAAKRKRDPSADVFDKGEADKRARNGQHAQDGEAGNRRYSGSMIKDSFAADARPTAAAPSWRTDNRSFLRGGAPRQDQGDQFRDHLQREGRNGWEAGRGSGLERGGGGRSRGRGRRGGGQARGSFGRGGHGAAHSDPE